MTKKRPAFQKRLNHMRVTVWANTTENNSGDKNSGATWFSTEIKRRYQDGTDWHDSYSLNGVADIVLAIEGLTQARNFIRDQEACAEVVDTKGDDDE